jgi:hypothetical protein
VTAGSGQEPALDADGFCEHSVVAGVGCSECDRDAYEVLRAERDALRVRVAEVAELHRKSTFPASRGEHKGRHYCPSCTTSIDFFTAYVDWPCATARAALSPQEGT